MWAIIAVAVIYALGVQSEATSVSCGGVVKGISNDRITRFQVTNELAQDITVSDNNSSFLPLLILQDSSNETSIIGSPDIDCKDVHCDGVKFLINSLLPGDYTVGMVSKMSQEPFHVDVQCFEHEVDESGMIIITANTHSNGAT